MIIIDNSYNIYFVVLFRFVQTIDTIGLISPIVIIPPPSPSPLKLTPGCTVLNFFTVSIVVVYTCTHKVSRSLVKRCLQLLALRDSIILFFYIYIF